MYVFPHILYIWPWNDSSIVSQNPLALWRIWNKYITFLSSESASEQGSMHAEECFEKVLVCTREQVEMERKKCTQQHMVCNSEQRQISLICYLKRRKGLNIDGCMGQLEPAGKHGSPFFLINKYLTELLRQTRQRSTQQPSATASSAWALMVI